MVRSRHHTGWTGALGVASELSRREYDAAITLGNTPSLDLICCSPGGISFTVQVKTTSSHNWILVKKSLLEMAPRDDLFFVVVYIPADINEALEYHLLTHAEAGAAYAAQRKVKQDGRPYKGGMEGLGWSDVAPHLGRWDKLPK